MQRVATAVWSGSARTGKGSVSTASGSIRNLPFADLPENKERSCTTPSELLAAAHASCITLMLAMEIAAHGHSAELIDTDVVLTFQPDQRGWHPTLAYVDVRVRADLDNALLQEIANKVASNCPISRLLHSCAELTMRVESLPSLASSGLD